jgi:hypothetical protein
MLIMGRIRQQDMTHSADFGNSVIHCHTDTGQEKYLNDPLFAGRLNQIIAGADKCMIHFIPRAKIFTALKIAAAAKRPPGLMNSGLPLHISRAVSAVW